MLFRKNTIKLDEEILAQTVNGKETAVKYGQQIGKKA